jgi:hypothetical protein
MAHADHLALRKTGLLLLTVAAACLAASGPARAGHTLLEFQSALEELWAVDPAIEPPPDNGSRDFAVGGFQGPDGNNFGFSAHSGPSGEDPRGHLSETIPGVGQARFRVTCLAVLGNQAAMGLVPTDTASNDVPAERVLSVFDSGLPGGTGDRFKFYSSLDDVDVSADQCDAFVAGATLPIVRGNLSVHDVP